MSILLVRCLMLLAVLLGAGGGAAAGGLSVLPTRLDFGATRGVQSVLLTNTSAQTVSIETEVVVWPEGAGSQRASDIVVTPAVVTLPPNQRVRVRIGLLRQSEEAREQAYRLYFTELPAPSPMQGAGIGVRLRIGIPVFVAPGDRQPQPLRWSAAAGPQGWQLELRNDGNVHTRLTRPELVIDGRTMALQLPSPYVLAQSALTVALSEPLKPGTRVRWLEGGGDERESSVGVP